MSDACSIQTLLDDVAADVEPEDVAGLLLGVRRVVGELDAARLAAPAGQHLGLDDDLPAELLGCRARLLGRRREPSLRDRDAELRWKSCLPWYS